MSGVRKHGFGQIHQIRVGGIGLIKLNHGEFRVMPCRNPFISEIPVDLKYPLKPTHNQSFQVELGGNPQIQVDSQRIVMGFKWGGFCPAGYRLHHGGFHFKKITVQ